MAVGAAHVQFADFVNGRLENLRQSFVQRTRRLAVGGGIDAIGQIGVKGFVRKSLQQSLACMDERLFILLLDRDIALVALVG